ncbi:MAG: DoxX family protein [Kofleriaceae bacterium]
MSLHQAQLAERIAFGRPLDPDAEPEIALTPRPTTALIGRILIGTIFVVSGLGKLTHLDQTAGFMASVGIPSPHGLAILAGLAELLGGLSLVFGLLSRLGALGLMLFLIPTTLLFHNFWRFSGPEQQTQLVNFLKNLAIFGGLLLMFAYGPGRYSLDARMRRPMQP